MGKDIKKIKSYYYALIDQKKVIDEQKNDRIHHTTVGVLESTFDEIEKNFPGLVPKFNPQEFFSHKYDKDNYYYYIAGISSFIGRAISKLKVEIEESEITPITEKRDFPFISDNELRKILERDYLEIQIALIAQCWKSVIIMCGSAMEAILLDLLKQDEEEAKSSQKAPAERNLEKWSLNDLIEVAIDLELVTEGIAKLSHSVREYRNIIHPGNEIRNKIEFGKEEARIAIEVLNILHRDLLKKK